MTGEPQEDTGPSEDVGGTSGPDVGPVDPVPEPSLHFPDERPETKVSVDVEGLFPEIRRLKGP